MENIYPAKRRYREQYRMVKVNIIMAHFKKPEAADQALASVFKKNYPRLKVAKNDSNRGSGGAWNTGFQLINPDSKYVAFVDCDLIFDSNWLSEMVKVAEIDPEIGGCQPKILSFWEPSMFEYNGSAGMWMDVYGYALNRGRIFYNIEKDVGQYNSKCETFFIGGSVLFARSDVLKRT